MKKSTIIKLAVSAAVVALVVLLAMHLGPDFLAAAKRHLGGI